LLFTAPQYIFAFLPVVLLVYFTLNRLQFVQCGKAWMVLASLYFYGYWNPAYLILIIGSMVVNFGIGNALHVVKQSEQPKLLSRKTVLVIGIAFNLGLLGYYKYTDFLLANANIIFGSEYAPLNLLLPLAISFFTFQQIAYLVDCYQFDTQEYDFLSYCLFVSFFPQLIAGPIVHHKEMMPQFYDRGNGSLHYEHLAQGVLIFCIGLFKKVVIADTFAVWANAGFDGGEPLALFEAWGASLSYTLQLYYDFSGYSDMAIGAALMFNIRLPVNFNSPYKALNIQDFWRRWHMTLSRWLRDYLYIPLGGNRRVAGRIYVNLMATFVLGGLWHGAGWTFVLWGALHGVALCVHRLWSSCGIKMPAPLALLSTFMFVNFAWVLFRAEDMATAQQMLQGMAGMNGVMGATDYREALALLFSFDAGETVARLLVFDTALCILVFTGVALFAKNSLEIGLEKIHYSVKDCVTVSAALMLAILLGIATRSPVFLYFNF